MQPCGRRRTRAAGSDGVIRGSPATTSAWRTPSVGCVENTTPNRYTRPAFRIRERVMAKAVPAPGGLRRRYPLAVHIATLFVALLLVAGVAIGGIAYYRSAAMLTRAADDLFDRVARETTHEVREIVAPGEALIDVLAQTRLVTARTLDERLDTLPLLREALAVSPYLSALYAGYDNGDFFLVRRVPDVPEWRKQLGAPDGAAYLVQSLERGAGVFIWLDAGFGRLATQPRPEYATFDARE